MNDLEAAKADRRDKRTDEALGILGQLGDTIVEHGCKWLVVCGECPDGDAITARLVMPEDLYRVLGQLEEVKIATALALSQMAQAEVETAS